MRRKSTQKPKVGNRFVTGQQKAMVHPLEGVIFEGKVRDVATNGQAVVEHSSGVAVFVRGAWLDELVTIKITQFKKRYALGELVSVNVPSEYRIAPACKHFSTMNNPCGGCAWLFVDYAAQLAVKQAWVERAFMPLMNGQKIEPIKASEAMGYRNRAEFKSDGKLLGYLSVQSDQLVDVKTCPVLTPVLSAHLDALRAQLPNPDWKLKPTQGAKKAHSRTLLAVDDTMLMGELSLNKRLPFKQANAAQNIFLQSWLALALNSASKQQTVLELFAGSGNFTQVLAGMDFSQIIAAELAHDALNIMAASQLPNVIPVAVNLFDEQALQGLCDQYSNAKTLVLDPPRDGLVCIQPLLALRNIETIAYISCDLASALRDVTLFVDKGFAVSAVQPVDMFAQTPHVELCILLVRKLD